MAAKSTLTKPQFITAVADAAEVTKVQATAVLEALAALVVKQLRGPGAVTIPGVCKVTLKRVAAKPARMGRNPATGEPMQFKAKPASKAVKIKPIKAMKDAVL